MENETTYKNTKLPESPILREKPLWTWRTEEGGDPVLNVTVNTRLNADSEVSPVLQIDIALHSTAEFLEHIASEIREKSKELKNG